MFLGFRSCLGSNGPKFGPEVFEQGFLGDSTIEHNENGCGTPRVDGTESQHGRKQQIPRRSHILRAMMSCRLVTRGHLFAQIHGWTGEHNSLPVAGSNACRAARSSQSTGSCLDARIVARIASGLPQRSQVETPDVLLALRRVRIHVAGELWP